MRHKLPITLQEQRSIAGFLVVSIILALAVFDTADHSISVGLIFEVIAVQLIFQIACNRLGNIGVLSARLIP